MWHIYCFLIISSINCIIQVHGHGTMVPPVNWFDHPHFVVTKKGWKVDYNGIKSGSMCMSGCFLNHKDVRPESQNSCNGMPYPGCSSCGLQITHSLINQLYSVQNIVLTLTSNIQCILEITLGLHLAQLI